MAGRLRGLRGSEAAVFLLLVAHANGEGLAWMSTRRIAEEGALKERAAWEALARLKQRRLISPAGLRAVHRKGRTIRVAVLRVLPPDVLPHTLHGGAVVNFEEHPAQVCRVTDAAPVAGNGTTAGFQPSEVVGSGPENRPLTPCTVAHRERNIKERTVVLWEEKGQGEGHNFPSCRRGVPPLTASPPEGQGQRLTEAPVVWQRTPAPKTVRPCARCGQGRLFWFRDSGGVKQCVNCRPPKAAGEAVAWLANIRGRWRVVEVYQVGLQSVRGPDGVRYRVHRRRVQFTMVGGRPPRERSGGADVTAKTLGVNGETAEGLIHGVTPQVWENLPPLIRRAADVFGATILETGDRPP